VASVQDVMKTILKIVPLLAVIISTGVLIHRNRALRATLAQQHERIDSLTGLRIENLELRRLLSCERLVDSEVETLRQQARDVHRLRGYVGEVQRLRRENSDLSFQLNQLTNQIQHWGEQYAELARQTRVRQENVRLGPEERALLKGWYRVNRKD
jgi:hypothetical protein